MPRLSIRISAVLLACNVMSAGAWAVDSSVLSREPAPNAPQGVKDLQMLIGDWACGSSNLNDDGTWQETPHEHVWKWYYTLNGQAIQDYWFPDEESRGTPGTNLRMFDREAGTWYIAWSTLDMADFDYLSASYDGEEYVLTGHNEAAGGRPEHERRITFHNISGEHFDWKYEARGTSDESSWSEMARLSCDRREP